MIQKSQLNQEKINFILNFWYNSIQRQGMHTIEKFDGEDIVINLNLGLK